MRKHPILLLALTALIAASISTSGFLSAGLASTAHAAGPGILTSATTNGTNTATATRTATRTATVAAPTGTAAATHYQATTDDQRRSIFCRTVLANLQQSGTAVSHLSAQRRGQSASWSSAPSVHAAAPPLFVQPIAMHVLAGTSVDIFVSTKPGTPITYRLVAQGAVLIAHGIARADARGRYVLSVHDRYLPRHAVTVLATITVTGPAGSRSARAVVTLLPRTLLPLTISIARQAVHAGQPLTVLVSTTPDTRVTLTLLLAATLLARGSGITNPAGHWTFTTAVMLSFPRAKAGRIVVQVSHGIDHASGHTAFQLQPGQPPMVDRLARANNPSPTLSRFFAQTPDKVIMVSAATNSQTLRAYDHGVLVHEDYVTTGMPALPTPPGIYQVLAKYAPYEMVSPWPAGSPFYYPPSWTHFAMLFRSGGYFLHDAPWRTVYGPGTNLPHASDPGEPIGTHGCVNLPYADMVWLWNWTPIGTTVVVY